MEWLSEVLYKLEECVRLSLSPGVSRRYIETWRDVSVENGTTSYKNGNGRRWLGAYRAPGTWHLLIKASVQAGPAVFSCVTEHVTYLLSEPVFPSVRQTALCAGSS